MGDDVAIASDDCFLKTPMKYEQDKIRIIRTGSKPRFPKIYVAGEKRGDESTWYNFLHADILYIYIIEMFKSKESQFGSIFVPGEKAIIFIGGVAVNGESLT